MSNPDIDYSNTIIYKITCKDPSIQDVYVGHTVNFVQRKKAHRLCCMNGNSHGHNCKVYKVIRNNGGWNNWSMDIVAFYKCKDLNEARQKEQEHFVALNATMNSIEPFPSKPVNRVNRVKRVIPVKRVRPVRVNKSTYNQNIQTSNRHSKIFNCEPCHFVTTCKRDYERHILTEKHLDGGSLANQIIKTSDGYSCPCCKKIFKSRTSTYKHISKCSTSSPPPAPSASIPSGTTEPQISDDMTKNLMNMMMMMIQQNTEFQSKMMEMCKNGGMSNSHNTNTNTTTPANHPFNMNLFLNEQCKDAMNMTDFVNSIQLNLTDLENVGRLGYVKGMSNIIIDNLQKLDVYKRPVHCSDVKRETLYVKDNNEWARDGPRHPKMANAVRALEEKNEALIEEWANQHPNCMNDGTRENKQYLKIRNAITLGSIAKVICRVSKTIVIEK